MRELDHAREMLHKGEYIADEIMMGRKLLSNLKVRGDFGAKIKTAKKRIVAEPHARIRTILMGSIVFVA
jgi:tRNA-dihydrouridine synthase